MNRVAILLICLLTASTVLATEKPQKKKKLEGALVVSAPKTVAKPWEPTAFIQEGEHLPGDYTGLDPKKFLAMFKSKVEGLRKGEFETSEEFAQRTTNQDALLAPINTSDLYAFRIDNINYTDNINIKYDADTQAYIIGGSFGYSCEETYSFGKSKDWVTCKVASVSRINDTYTGSNAYGASLPVERTRGGDFALAIPKGSPVLSTVFSQDRYLKNTYIYQDKLSVPLEKARNLKDMKIAVLFVGRVSEAKIVEGRGTRTKPKIDSPNDIFIMEEAVPFDLKKIFYYVIQTGEILGQRVF